MLVNGSKRALMGTRTDVGLATERAMPGGLRGEVWTINGSRLCAPRLVNTTFQGRRSSAQAEDWTLWGTGVGAGELLVLLGSCWAVTVGV